MHASETVFDTRTPPSLLRRLALNGLTVEVSGVPVDRRLFSTLVFGHSGTDAYRATLVDVRSQVEAEFPGKVRIMDRTKPALLDAWRMANEVGRPLALDDALRFRALGPHYGGFASADSRVMYVFGPEPKFDPAALYLGGLPGAKAHPLDSDAAQRTVMWHEVGHILLGPDEHRADAFAALKMIQETRSTAGLDFVIAAREFVEWTGYGGDDHVSSDALRAIREEFGNPEFWDAPHSLADLRDIAASLPEQGPTRATAFRDAVAEARAPAGHFYVPVKEGFVVTDQIQWAQASKSVPECARIAELAEWLRSGSPDRQLPAPFRENRAWTADAVGVLAEAGDPTMRRIAPAFGGGTGSSDVPLTPADGVETCAADVDGRLVAFDRADTLARFDKDTFGFLLKDAGTGMPLAVGDADAGITREFGFGLSGSGPAPAGPAADPPPVPIPSFAAPPATLGM